MDHEARPYDERARIETAIGAFVAAQTGVPAHRVTMAAVENFIANSSLYRPLAAAIDALNPDE